MQQNFMLLLELWEVVQSMLGKTTTVEAYGAVKDI